MPTSLRSIRKVAQLDDWNQSSFSNGDFVKYDGTTEQFVGSPVSVVDTDSVSEGTANLYFTVSRVRASLSSTTTGLVYDSSTGIFKLGTNYVIPVQAQIDSWTASGSSISGISSALTSNSNRLGNAENYIGLLQSDTSSSKTAISILNSEVLDLTNRVIIVEGVLPTLSTKVNNLDSLVHTYDTRITNLEVNDSNNNQTLINHTGRIVQSETDINNLKSDVNILKNVVAPSPSIVVRKNTGTDVGAKPRLNFIEGESIGLDVLEDNVDDEIDVKIKIVTMNGGTF